MYFNTDQNIDATDMRTCEFQTRMNDGDFYYKRGITDDMLPAYMVQQLQEMGVEYFNFVDSIPNTEEILYLTDCESEAFAKFFRHFRQSPINHFYNVIKKKLVEAFRGSTADEQIKIVRKYVGDHELEWFLNNEDSPFCSLWDVFWNVARTWYEWSILELLQQEYGVEDIMDCDVSPYVYDRVTYHRNAFGILTAVMKDGRTIRFASKDQKEKILLLNATRGNDGLFYGLYSGWSVVNASKKEDIFVKMMLDAL